MKILSTARNLFATAVMTAMATSAAAAPDVIRIGAPIPLTGALSPEAAKLQSGYDLWVETVNKSGGIKVGDKKFKVEMVYADYQSNTPKAVQTTEKLVVQDKVNFLFSPLGSGATKAASSVAEKYEIPMLAPTASSDQVYDQGYKYLFGLFTPNQSLTNSITDLVKAKTKNVEKVAILARNDLFPLSIAQEMEKSAKARNLDVVFFEKFAVGTMDHASSLTQIKAKAPQWIFVTGYLNDLILVKKQLTDLGIKAPVVTMLAGPAYKEFVAALGNSAENVSSVAWWHPAVRYNGKDLFGTTENFNAAYRAKYKNEADYAAASSAAAGAVLQLAIERVNSIDPKKVRDALASINEMTFYGPVKFGSNGQITDLEPPVFQIQGGKPVILSPAAVSQGNLALDVK
ncbi:MAG TPA: amino acid ABC transporter substrate-binding protein [Burkholderiaceae bacterium]|nr:amino acid ABC transporter substrate-binding protein [Burkholderiaceae bacterium]